MPAQKQPFCLFEECSLKQAPEHPWPAWPPSRHDVGFKLPRIAHMSAHTMASPSAAAHAVSRLQATCQKAVPEWCCGTHLLCCLQQSAQLVRTCAHVLTWGLPSIATCGPVALGVPLLLPAPMPVLVGLVGGLNCCCLLLDESRTSVASEVLLRTSFTRKITVAVVAA